jgi:uncharacterized protein YqgC (DUF456 family)
MDGSVALLLWILAIGLVLIGIVGTVVPGLPGAVLVLAGLVLGAWIDGFARVGWATLAGLVALTVAAYAFDFAATAIGARRFGTSWWGVLGALVGTLGGLFFGPVGLVLGPFLGAFVAELIARRDLRDAGRAGLGAWLGLLLGTAGRLALVLAMVGLFAVAYLR